MNLIDQQPAISGPQNPIVKGDQLLTVVTSKSFSSQRSTLMSDTQKDSFYP